LRITSLLVGFSTLAMAAAIVVRPGSPHGIVLVLVSAVVFIVPAVGTFWMLYMTIRYELQPLHWILWAVLPYSFIWYYLERVRKRKPRSAPAIK
jgi:hypothetical protein